MPKLKNLNIGRLTNKGKRYRLNIRTQDIPSTSDEEDYGGYTTISEEYSSQSAIGEMDVRCPFL